jgi:hypothetical protein
MEPDKVHLAMLNREVSVSPFCSAGCVSRWVMIHKI